MWTTGLVELRLKFVKRLRDVSHALLHKNKQDANQLEWKKIALVCDRFLFWAFTIVTAVSATLILFSSPYGPTLSMFNELK